MPRRIRLVPSVLLLAIGAVPSPCVRPPARSQEQGPEAQIMPIRDAETETLPHSFACLDARLVRITLVRNRAINAFAGTGNRMFLNTARPA
jgi:hypothetical protein